MEVKSSKKNKEKPLYSLRYKFNTRRKQKRSGDLKNDLLIIRL